MSQRSYDNLVLRLRKEIKMFVEGGVRIIEGGDTYLDSSSLRTAANQFRQAAKSLDELDGAMQAKFALNVPESNRGR